VSLEAESQLLATDAGRQTAAKGVFDGIAAYFGNRPLAARIDALIPGGEAGLQPSPVDGSGPPFWPPTVSGRQLTVRLINTGTAGWPTGLRLAAGWGATAAPYLPAAPRGVAPLDATIPALEPGASIELPITLSAPASGRQVAWITLLQQDGTSLAQAGSPALQVATRGS
jgi:hypothetical protein